jgi:serine/threonine protein kinase
METVETAAELSGATPVAVLEAEAVLEGKAVAVAVPAAVRQYSAQPSDFIILRVIGRGAYGKVLQVAHAASGRVYAMKVYSKAVLAAQRQLEYTESEKSIMARLRHPYIVALRFAFQTRTRLFLISDYCGGGELFNTLRKRGLLQEDAAKVYLGQLVLALEHMHAAGVLHRDIKPENILLDMDGHVAITDFGLSKDFLGCPEPQARTRSLVGTDGQWPFLCKQPLRTILAAHSPNTHTHTHTSALSLPPAEYLAPEMILNSRWWAAQCTNAAIDRRDKLATEAAAAAAAAQSPAAPAPAPVATSAEDRDREVKAAVAAAEQLPGYGRSVDFWSLGTLAYEMMCGELPGMGAAA